MTGIPERCLSTVVTVTVFSLGTACVESYQATDHDAVPEAGNAGQNGGQVDADGSVDSGEERGDAGELPENRCTETERFSQRVARKGWRCFILSVRTLFFSDLNDTRTLFFSG